MKKTLIVYYSLDDGNTRQIVNMIKEVSGADIERIRMVSPYVGSYDDIVEMGREETETKHCPEIKPLAADMNSYDVIVLGTPVWWYTMAPAMRSFLSENSLKGKTVIPFATCAGWPGHVLKDVESLAAGSHIELPFAVKFDMEGRGEIKTSRHELQEWINQVRDFITR
jgi:flavodoxin